MKEAIQQLLKDVYKAGWQRGHWDATSDNDKFEWKLKGANFVKLDMGCDIDEACKSFLYAILEGMEE